MARKASSCADCLAWGVLNNGRRCGSCSVWRHKHPGESACTGCGRILAVKDGYCRLCWQQARYQSKTAGGLPRGAVSVLGDGGRVPWHQLFFDRTQLRRPQGRVRKYDRRGAQAKPPPAPAGRPAFRWVQPRLFDAWRDFTRFDEDTARRPRQPVAGLGTLPGLAARRGTRLAAGTAVLRPPGAGHPAVPAPARRHHPVLRDRPAAPGPGPQVRADRRGAPGDGRAGR